MASRAGRKPWSDDERAVLEDFAECRDWVDDALRELPGRSKAAARSMMQKVRASLGISRTEQPWMAEAVQASAKLLEALNLTGVRP